MFDRAAVSHSEGEGERGSTNASPERRVGISGADTAGRLGMFETVLPPGGGAPLHVHEREDEFFRVLSGRFGFWCAGDHVELTDGGCIALPRGIPHRFENVGETEGRVMVLVTPAGFEQFFPTLASRKATSPSEIGAVAAEFGVRFVEDEKSS